MDGLAARRERAIRAMQLDDAVILIGAGEPVPLPEGSDQTYPFRSHAEFVYFTNRESVGGVLAADVQAGVAREWLELAPDPTERERVYDGRETPGTTPLTALAPWLAARRGRTIVALGAALPGVRADEERSLHARAALVHARRVKDAGELSLIRRAAAATAPAYASLRERIRPGVTERQLAIELDADFCRAGASRPGYATIVGAGPNAAILHSMPTARAARAGDFVLVDAAAEVERWMVDVTRTFCVGAPSAFQRDLHQVVLNAQQRAVAACVPGAEWKEVHLGAARDMVAGLVAMGVMRGSAESLVERNAHLLFFPHGVGHMVGLGVRDGSGSQPGRAKDPRACLENLRMDLPLAAGYVLTVEPGLYFIPYLLRDAARRERHRDDVNWALVDEHIEIGGVRIEDSVHVTENGPENLTGAIPRAL
jgi:Xaa-Pro aminopeptidase